MSIEYSPLRYPGAKAQLAPFIAMLFDHNEFYDYSLAEPFCGGGSISINMLVHSVVDEVHINDLCPYVYSFWRLVADGPEELCRKIWDTEVTIEEYGRQKEIAREPDGWSGLELAFCAFFLSRVGFGGRIYKTGVRGGVNQDKEWRIDDNYNKKKSVAKIEAIHTMFGLGPIKVYNMHFMQFLEHLNKNVRDVFIYMDPPYYDDKTKFYRFNFKHDDHERMAKYMQDACRHPWVTSYDDRQEIIDMYPYAKHTRKRFKYSFNKKAYEKREDAHRASELILHSPSVRVPDDFEEKLASVAKKPARDEEDHPQDDRQGELL